MLKNLAALLILLTTVSNLHAQTVTQWDVRPSLKYDALCLLNTLTGDSFYTAYYPEEYAHFLPLLSAEGKTNLQELKRLVKDEGGGIISASLCLYFSAVEDSTLDDMLRTLANPDQLQANFKTTPYYSDSDWELFLQVKPVLAASLTELKRIHFEEYWKTTILPKVQERVVELRPELLKFDVIRENNLALGAPLPSTQITVYMLYYSQPHGIKITGTRFLTDVAWPFEIVVRNAAHEMMHPPFDLTNDTELKARLETLKADSFFMQKVEHHNPDFGYNTFDGFIEEDCVQALEQIVTERLDVADEPRARWQASDDGMHVFAVALYSLMKEQNYNSRNEPFRDFLIRAIDSGTLTSGTIQPRYEKFYQP